LQESSKEKASVPQFEAYERGRWNPAIGKDGGGILIILAVCFGQSNGMITV
jgi:hypothetical protein